ncbi:MAG: hypothetical protein Q8L48_19595 [Archangium sp.]|nr:hypothetical protein [Archangium sp.]
MDSAFGALKISPQEMTEWQDGRPVVSLARADVRDVLVEHGFIAERLPFQLVFAGGLALVSALLTTGAMVGLLPVKAAYSAPAIGFGGWMVAHVLERGFVVKVTTIGGDTRKLRLGSDLSLASAFVAEARKLGWTVVNIGALTR